MKTLITYLIALLLLASILYGGFMVSNATAHVFSGTPVADSTDPSSSSSNDPMGGRWSTT